MPAIREALTRLKQSVSRLEQSMHGMELAMAGQQRDMFGEIIPAKGGKNNGNGLPFDSALISKKLDKAIKKVEELLDA